MAFQDFDLISERRKKEKQAKLRRRIITALVLVVVILLAAAAAFAYFVVLKAPHEEEKEKHSSKTNRAHKPKSSPPHLQPPPKSETTEHAEPKAAAAAAEPSDPPTSKAAAVVDRLEPPTSSPSKAAAIVEPPSEPPSEAPSQSPSEAPAAIIGKAEKVIAAICAGTDYNATCEDSLGRAVKENASVARSPKELLRSSMAIAVEEIDKAMKQGGGLKLDTPHKKAAMDDCKVLLADAVEELNSSMAGVGSSGPESTPDLNNYLSAVITFQDNCVDGFPDGEEKTAVRNSLKAAEEIASNALAMVSQISSALQIPDLDPTRNLLADEEGREFPAWMDHEERRILKVEAPKQPANATVAKDGSGNFTTINAALAAIPPKYDGRYVIFVKEGIYEENVVVTKKMVNLTMYGVGSKKTIVTGSKNFVDGVSTYQTATFAVVGDGFIGQSMGFRNTAGPEKHQAVALRVQADRAIFISCRMEGYQDTLYVQAHRQFYRGCYITGTIDFIFGNAAAVFQNCMIYARKPMENQQNIVTAQGRTDRRQTTGIVLQNCKILADDTLEPEKAKTKSYLGRPWKEYSRTVVMESEIGDFIHPEGWMPWSGDFALETLYYAEYANSGPGASVKSRVKWGGYKGEIEKKDAMEYTVGPFLQGDTWLKASECPARFGLTK